MDWNVYKFGPSDALTTRVRRLERGQQYERRGSLVVPSGSYSGIPILLLDNNRIDLSSSGLSTKGSIPPAGVSGNFGFSATTTSITVYWDGTNSSNLLAVLRADGSAVQIPGNSLTISGLASATTYGFIPFWSAFNNCGVGWVVGDAGSPMFAFTAAAQTATAAMKQVLQGREQLTGGFITYATTASGSTSGSGGGAGGIGGHCVMLGSDIEPLGDSTYSTKHYQNDDWLRFECEQFPKSLHCTEDHPLFSPDHGRQDARLFNPGDWIITDQGERKLSAVQKFVRVCTKVEVEMPSGHLFFANGYLSHNVKANFA